MMDRLNKLAAYTFCAFAFGVQAAFAGDPHHADTATHGAEHAEGSAGLPQFNPEHFPTQIFWLAVTFLVMYAIFSSRILPDISGILENRRMHIDNDLETADRLRKEADDVQATYEAQLGNARSEAKKMVNDIHSSTKAKAEAHLQSLREKAEKDMHTLEIRLQSAKDEAMEQMGTIAAEVASEAAAKIMGAPADLAQAKNVVQLISKREAA
ncbi:MAG: hypothetical protein HYS17_07805 [Micavibrio aeruginosavorus]|uniref:ATP synthase subunit b n=1 Tax=Micavibrio aeruginosavorus TaxID=349221 RepID=A0A7T5R0U0_9BACT|nr:MAG: hypothetical protein HYS17_07805 [Micavibrio aeruginosavorus]